MQPAEPHRPAGHRTPEHPATHRAPVHSPATPRRRRGFGRELPTTITLSPRPRRLFFALALALPTNASQHQKSQLTGILNQKELARQSPTSSHTFPQPFIIRTGEKPATIPQGPPAGRGFLRAHPLFKTSGRAIARPLTFFPSALFHPRGSKASKDTVGPTPGVFSSERSRSAKREDQRRKNTQGRARTG